MATSVRVHLDASLYPPTVVAEALDAFHDSILLDRGGDNDGHVTITTSETDAAAVDEFLNYLLMAALEQHLVSR